MKTLALLLAASLASASHLSGRAADGTVKANAFNYTDLGGPLNWYGLNTTANSACSKGSHQSPIDIMTQDIEYTSNGSTKFEVPSVYGARFENLGSGLEVVMANGSLTANGTTFPLAQFHFHTPSEHRVNEEYFPMECHFVFQTKG
jgi:carbonic anhydrase